MKIEIWKGIVDRVDFKLRGIEGSDLWNIRCSDRLGNEAYLVGNTKLKREMERTFHKYKLFFNLEVQEERKRRGKNAH